ncbi:hypothetical protein ASF49_08025 [Methylobacterium sp. Leaf104]|uniref:hypothetical protein n=1 Tax=Methylobacterium TaxID=407 RepID=UPI0006F3B49D|nr:MULTISPECIES: hypothetical protein [Methylobacterium]KQP33804.1 hypothetical protein ASF49_08025 [Methylobacterium sp. Leaf104]MCI9879628.1 hypothetical protein [Methylobacterium goesingense]
MGEGCASINKLVYETPSPEKVARIFAACGAEAAEERWHWIEPRTLGGLARAGRAILSGTVSASSRVRTASPEQEAVAIEAGFVLGSRKAGERAAGMGLNTLMCVEHERGILDMPRISPRDRGRNAQDGHAANRGDADAAARIEARHAHERAVAGVLRVALAMVPDQPSTGRYRLPKADGELAAALVGHDPAAIAAVFPGLAEAPVTPSIQEPAPMTVAPAKTATAPAPRVRGRAPDADQIRLDHAETTSIPELASRWGISESGAYQALRRVGLTGHRGFMATPARSPEAPAVEVVPPAAPVPEPETNVVAIRREAVELPAAPPPPSRVVIQARAPEPVRIGGRLGLEDLALAYRLACECGIPPEEALHFVRADVAAEAGHPGVYA